MEERMKKSHAFYLLLAVIIISACQSGTAPANQTESASHGHHNASTAPTPRVPAFFSSPTVANPLPPVLDPAQFDNPVVSRAYDFARANREIFAQQPCYCYCDDGFGHRSLLDCFATDHSAG